MVENTRLNSWSQTVLFKAGKESGVSGVFPRTLGSRLMNTEGLLCSGTISGPRPISILPDLR